MLDFLLALGATITLFCAISYLRVLHQYMCKIRVDESEVNDVKTQKYYNQAPGPLPLPIIGNLHQLRQHSFPFKALTVLSKVYGNIYSLTLGTTRCLVVNNIELIREVLNQNGKFFGGRPNFLRYHQLFGGDRSNSLALCDWSNLQQKRRNLARRHCSPRDSSTFFTKMSDVGCFEVCEMIDKLSEKLVLNKPFEIKPLLQKACANMFMQYMSSVRFDYDDFEFTTIVEYFDEIFWEINQGYAVDFLPWLAPFYQKHFKKIIFWSTTIRKFILDRIIDEREHNLDLEEPERDFTDALLKSLIEDKNVTRDTIIFMLEDFIGGHSAVGNLVMMALTYSATSPEVGTKIRAEADRVSQRGKRKINLFDMEAMPYTMATIYEVLRYSSSPIVPHVATEDTVIHGYGVKTGTVVFINNYNLNTSSEYWKNPEKFEPERFLEETKPVNSRYVLKRNSVIKRRNSEGSDSGVEFEREVGGLFEIKATLSTNPLMSEQENIVHKKLQVKKNLPHFLPFSIGKRTCIGQNLVRGFGFILLANILQKYDISIHDISIVKINPACIALPSKTHSLCFSERNVTNHNNRTLRSL